MTKREVVLYALPGQVLMACILLLAACRAAPAEGPPVAAAFGQASRGQIEQALYSFMRPVDHAENEYAMALADADASDSACPRVEREGQRTIILAEGCVAPSGHRYAGRIEHVEADVPDYEMIFTDYRRTTPEGEVYRYDGSILADVGGMEDGVFQNTLTLERPDVVLDIDVTTNCRAEEGAFVCTFAPDSWVDVGGLGRFVIEGSFRDAPGEEPSGMLVYRGADVMRVDILPRWCMRYTIAGSEPRTVCPDQALSRPRGCGPCSWPGTGSRPPGG